VTRYSSHLQQDQATEDSTQIPAAPCPGKPHSCKLLLIGHALGAVLLDASVRVSVFQPDGDERPSVMVVMRPPGEPPVVPQRLATVAYERPVAHIKHAGTFGQIWHGRQPGGPASNDALLTGPGGVTAEGAITNIGFYDGTAVTWPGAPALAGITMQLVAAALAGRGTLSRHGTVRLADCARSGPSS
jgi:hypothetical protein